MCSAAHLSRLVLTFTRVRTRGVVRTLGCLGCRRSLGSEKYGDLTVVVGDGLWSFPPRKTQSCRRDSSLRTRYDRGVQEDGTDPGVRSVADPWSEGGAVEDRQRSDTVVGV